MKKMLTAALLGVAMVGGVAYAQTSQPGSQTPPAASPSTPSASSAAAGQKMDLKGSWRSSKLIGLDVYNDGNEKLGDISELIMDKEGKVKAVIIGVGGFLGVGQHDIAVTMDKLKFVEEPVRTSSATSTTAPARNGTTTGAATTTTGNTSSTMARSGDANDWAPDHAVMSATKDQLKSMPQFKYSE